MGGKMENKKDHYYFEGSHGKLSIKENDKVARKLAMLIEGSCMKTGPIKASQKYGYTKQRYYQVREAYEKDGIQGLFDKKSGPKKNFVRTNGVVDQIVRHRFLDPDASAGVIAQKLKQVGIKVSKRSVERTITEKGLQKKTSFVKSGKKNARN